MTRVNLVPLDMLADQHLFAEMREIKWVPLYVNRALKTHSLEKMLSNIPNRYTLGVGHVKFFYDKMSFLKTRYEMLFEECVVRGYQMTKNFLSDSEIFDTPFAVLQNGYNPNPNEVKISAQRIYDRLMMKPSWYKYRGVSIGSDLLKKYETLISAH